MGAEHAHRLAGLDQQGLVVFKSFQHLAAISAHTYTHTTNTIPEPIWSLANLDNLVETLPRACSATNASVHNERLRVFGDLD